MKIIAAIIAALGLTAAGAWFYIDHSVHATVDEFLRAQVEQGRYEEAHYGDLSYTYSGDISLYDLHIRQAGVTMLFKQVDIADIDLENEFPHRMDISIDGIQIVDGLDELLAGSDPNVAVLTQWFPPGEVIPLHASYRYDYAPENEHHIDSAMNITLPEYGTLSVSGIMRKLSLADLSAMEAAAAGDPAQAQAQMLQLFTQAEIPRLAVSLQDLGMLEKYFEEAAVEFNTQPEQYKNMLISQARNAYLFAPAMVQELAQDAGDQLAEFLEGGRTLTLTLEPQFNGSVQQLQPQIMGAVFTNNINAVVDLLNLELVTQQDPQVAP